MLMRPPPMRATEPPFRHLARQANKMLEQMQKGFYVYSGDAWTPNVNLYETTNNYIVCVDLSGVDKEKIDVHVADHRLTLKGSRAVPSIDHAMEGTSDAESAKPVRIHLMEIDHGPFSREVELPADAKRESIVATYRSGLLWIEIPKQ